MQPSYCIIPPAGVFLLFVGCCIHCQASFSHFSFSSASSASAVLRFLLSSLCVATRVGSFIYLRVSKILRLQKNPVLAKAVERKPVGVARHFSARTNGGRPLGLRSFVILNASVGFAFCTYKYVVRTVAAVSEGRSVNSSSLYALPKQEPLCLD